MRYYLWYSHAIILHVSSKSASVLLMVLLTADCRYYNRGKIMTVISRTHQVPIKICPLFWKMIIIGCTAIIIVVVDGGNLEAFFESNSAEIISNWPI